MTIPNIDQPVSTDGVKRHVLMDAASNPERDTFAFADMVEVVRGEALASAFKAWVVERFYEVAETGFEFDVVIASPHARKTTVERPTDGWVAWRVKELTPALAVAGEPVHLRMERVLANDRGPSDYGPTVKVPLDVLFGERQRSERYEQYLALKAEFENEGGVR